MESDRQYYARRAAEELRAAERAKSPKAAFLHRILAEKYAHIVDLEPIEARASAEAEAASD